MSHNAHYATLWGGKVNRQTHRKRRASLLVQKRRGYWGRRAEDEDVVSLFSLLITFFVCRNSATEGFKFVAILRQETHKRSVGLADFEP